MAVGGCLRHGELLAGLYAEGTHMPCLAVGNVPVPAWLVQPQAEVWRYFSGLDIAAQFPCQRFDAADEDLQRAAWDEIFLGLRRWPVGGHGVVLHKDTAEEMGLRARRGDTTLGDNGGMAHEWYEYVPRVHKLQPHKPLPLLFVLHGGNTAAKYCAEQNRWHELGERYGFFVVYPQCCRHAAWNAGCDERLPSDEEYLLRLYDNLVAKYPIDTARVYCAGFSMGALMTQCMGMLHWDKFAAIAPFSGYLFDDYWQGPQTSQTQPYHLTRKRCEKLAEKGQEDATLPVIQFYGTQDPTWDKATEQKTVDFWTEWNRLSVIRFDEAPTSKAGSDERFSVYDRGDKNGCCLYRFVSVRDLAHAVDLRQSYLAWDFLSHFSRDTQTGRLVYEPLP